jgi:hypothetical protein
VRHCIASLRDHCAQRSRSLGDLYLAVAVVDAGPEDLPELQALGIDELVVVESPPSDAADATGWVRSLAARWIAPGARIV